jgi:hypothetical protein
MDHKHEPRNDHEKLMNALLQRADEDAQKFRAQHPDATPNDIWIENSYTAALPLAKDAVGIAPGQGPHPELFAAYRQEIVRRVGTHVDTRGAGDELTPMPTPGEH